MEGAIKQGQLFLSELAAEERSRLYSDLLSVRDVYLCNKDTSFYIFQKIHRVTKCCAECRRRTFLYQAERKGELLISQIHEQKRFKNHYRIQILFNEQEMKYAFLENLLQHLHNQHSSYNSQVIYAQFLYFLYVKRHGKEVTVSKIRFLLLVRKYNKLKEVELLTDLPLFWLFLLFYFN